MRSDNEVVNEKTDIGSDGVDTKEREEMMVVRGER